MGTHPEVTVDIANDALSGLPNVCRQQFLHACLQA
jgi:hypothetical protein